MSALTSAALITLSALGCGRSDGGSDPDTPASASKSAARDAAFRRDLQDAVVAAARGELALSTQLAGSAEQRAVELGDMNTAMEVAVLPGLWRLWATGDAPAAIRMVEEAIARRPLAGVEPPYPVDLVLAAFFADAAQPGRAQAVFSRYLRDAGSARSSQSPDLPPNFHAARGAIALAAGRHAEAVQALQTRSDHESDPHDLLARSFRLGLTLERLGARDEAIAVYGRVVEEAWGSLTRPDAWALPYALTAIADLLETRGDAEAAADYFGRFVELWAGADPELQAEVEEIRARLSGAS